MPESIAHAQTPEYSSLLLDITSDNQQRQLMLRPYSANTHIRNEIANARRSQILSLDSTQRLSLYEESLAYLADEQGTTQDQRDVLMLAFPDITYSVCSASYPEDPRSVKDMLMQPVVRAFESLPEDADVYGSFDALMQASILVAKDINIYANVAQRNDSVSAIEDLSQPFIAKLPMTKERQYANGLVKEFKSRVIWGEQANDDGQGPVIDFERSRPSMNNGEVTLHDEYLSETKSGRSLKSRLWYAVPEFRALCESKGVQLEKFWNKQSPDQVESSLGKVKNEVPDLFLRLSNDFRTKFNEKLDDLDVRIYADQIFELAKQLHKDLIEEQVTVDTTITRLQELTSREWKTQKAKRKFEGQIISMLREQGIEGDEGNIDWRSIKSYLESKNDEKDNQATYLADTFDFDSEETLFDIQGRTDAEMYLADVTGDCTAYHLSCGHNGFVVPVWLSMPNFVFATINSDSGGMIAKVGLMLAIRDEQPCLVIDSVEASKLIAREDQLGAAINIDEGLTAIMKWGKSIGFSEVYGYSFNNSSELIQQIRERSRAAGTASEFQVLGGLHGLLEYASPFLNGEEFRMYYQTNANEEMFEDMDVEPESDIALARFEQKIQAMMAQPKFEYLAGFVERADWQGFVDKYIQKEGLMILEFLETEDDRARFWAALDIFYDDDTTQINPYKDSAWPDFLEQFDKDTSDLYDMDTEMEELFAIEGLEVNQMELPQAEISRELDSILELKELESSLRRTGSNGQDAFTLLFGAAQVVTTDDSSDDTADDHDTRFDLPITPKLPRIVSHLEKSK